MKDAEYVFRKDIQDKKSIGRGAFHKKTGSKSKKCTLPSDYLSGKEKKALNSKVTTWDMKKFYSWEEFKEMPDDIQLEYVNSIINRYDCGLSVISEALFKKSRSNLSAYLKYRNLLQYVNNKNHPSTLGYHRLQKAIDDSNKQLQIEHQDTEPIGKVKSIEETNNGLKIETDLTTKFLEELNSSVNSTPATSISYFTIHMDQFDDDIWNQIKSLFAGHDGLMISISVSGEA